MIRTKLNKSLLKKISEKLNKKEQYLREQISKRSSKFGISSLAVEIVWARELGIGVASSMINIPDYVREQVRVTSSVTAKPSKKKSSPTISATNIAQINIAGSGNDHLMGVKIKNYNLHSEILRVTTKRFNSGQYADAIEAAYKLIIKCVKEMVFSKTDEKKDGMQAMGRAFDFDRQTPLIKFNNLTSDEEKDEQRGITMLFKGITFIRNSKAHDEVLLNDPHKAIEYLVLASLLMRLLDEYGVS